MTRPRFAISLAVRGLGLALFAAPALAQGPGGGGPPATVVELGVAERVPFEEPVVLVGSIAPRDHAELPAEVDGRIERWAVDEGGSAAAGDVLLVLDARDVRIAAELAEARVAEAEAQLAAARARADRARLDRERNRSLAEERLAATATLEAAEADFSARSAEVDSWAAELRARRAELQAAKLDLERSTIRAPFEGALVARAREAGEWVRVGESVGRWASTDRLEVAARVGASDLPYVVLGAPVEIVPDAFPTRRYPGEVVRRVAEADPVTRTFPVEIEVTEPGGDPGGPALAAGMLVQAHIVPTDRPPRLVVPSDALVLRGNTTLVYVPDADDATVEARRVRTGLALGDRVEIIEGIEEGERVVVTGNDGLRPGAPISVRE